MAKHDSRIPDYERIQEIPLTFDPVRKDRIDVHPLRGLVQHGPFSGKLSPSLVPSTVRLAFVAPEGYGARLRDYLQDLHEVHSPTREAGYFPDFPGFRRIFGVDLQVPQNRSDPSVSLSLKTLQEVMHGPDPERRFLALLETALRELMLRRSEFDVIIFYFPEFLAPIFKVREQGYEFDLHDATKALTASAGIPAQIILDRSIGYRDRCSVLWSLGVALYVKAGGIPWKLAVSSPGTAYVGLSYVLATNGEKQQVVTCCSQVFDDQGHGIQFLIFTAEDFVRIGRNPFLKRADMRRLLTKTLEVCVQHGGLPRRVVVHKTTHFTTDEREGAAEALGDLENYELLQVQEETAWTAVKGRGGRRPGEKGMPTPYPVDRGTVLPISRFSFLIWTQGDAEGVVRAGRSFYQEGKGIPSPLLITQHAGSTPLLETATELFGLTKMNWNTGRLYNNLPVTIKSASTLGDIAKYMTSVRQAPYLFRLFM